jgi:hypothetical protein
VPAIATRISRRLVTLLTSSIRACTFLHVWVVCSRGKQLYMYQP